MTTPPETDAAPRDDVAAVPSTAAHSATSRHIAAVVYNPIKVDLPALRQSVSRYEREAGWSETLWFATTEEDPGAGMARAALEAGADVVAAAGGDGTTRIVAEVVHGSGASLALLPSGTGNLLARNMRFPLDEMDTSVQTLFHGEDRAVDIGMLTVEREGGEREDFGFLVMAGLGLDARMLANTRPELKKRVGWLAYVDAVARSLRDSDNMEARYNLDGAGNRSLRAHTLIVGNCGTLQAGILLLPDATITDGVFDVVALRPKSVFGWARIGARLMWENAILRRARSTKIGQTAVGERIIARAREERPLRYMRGKEIVVRLETPDEFEIDGDPVGRIRAFRARIDEGGLTVRVPVGHVLH
ncbi:diacylglycerol kinase family protein [Curtobacterium sp. MCBD17_035]|uniref:diacylglycerol/lipid kinase family protein n=1 Tax=Curtobacterium sp. MCBD17_035 TaxID=2175673 RepID=UPI000DAA4DAE|nr:diacylglycerol kinase family protein [Curtobacterium sp. MCBD17_035]WIB68062.1 diacylglycerol kinase family protein [Curtobacterium sp. MCBD17_035]